MLARIGNKPILAADFVIALPNNLITCTLLHPAIQFDERMKQNIGLEFSVDLDYVNDNPFLSKETLQKSLVREVLVTSVRTIDNKFSLPVAVQYVGMPGIKQAKICKSSSQIRCSFCKFVRTV